MWGVALAPRIAAALLLPLASDYGVFEGGDPSSYWYPGYRAMARGLWLIGGSKLPTYVAAHIALHALVCPVVFLLAAELRLPQVVCWLSAVGVAILPYYVYLAAGQPAVGLVVVACAGFLLALAHLARRPERRLASAVLVALSGTFLVALRPNAAPMEAALLALALWRALRDRSDRRRAVRASATAGGLVAAIVWVLMWTWPRLTGESLVPHVSGYNLYIGQHPLLEQYLGRHDIGSLERVIYDHGLPPEAAGVSDPVARDRLLGRMALAQMRSDPGRVVRLAVRKSGIYWDWRLANEGVSGAPERVAYTVAYLIYGPLAVIGCCLLWRRGWHWPVALLATAVVAYWLPHTLYFGAIRMRLTTEFALVILAAGAVWAMATPRRQAVGDG